MSSILCNWINNDVGLGEHIDPNTFAKSFADGYLFGELLHKYKMQNDFENFLHGDSFEVKVQNFTRLKDTFSLLGIPFTAQMAKDIMMGTKPSATLHVIYQLKMALETLKPVGYQQDNAITAISLVAMKGQGKKAFVNMDAQLFEERIKQNAPRRVTKEYGSILKKFSEEQLRKELMETKKREQEEQNKLFINRERHDDILDSFHHTQRVHGEWADSWSIATPETRRIPKAEYDFQKIKLQREKEDRQMKQARKSQGSKRDKAAVIKSISSFEKTLKRFTINTDGHGGIREGSVDQASMSAASMVGTSGSASPAADKSLPTIPGLSKEGEQFIMSIKQRKHEEHLARQEREKRRRKVIVDQQRAQTILEETRREEILLSKLTQHSQQERKIATQLMNTRHEKDVITENRMFREEQYKERRERDFQDALRREAELARQARLEYHAQSEMESERHSQLAAERAAEKYQKHYALCSKILSAVIDLATKVGEYRVLTDQALPAKLLRDWKLLFELGQPIYVAEVAGSRSAGDINPDAPPGPVVSATLTPIVGEAEIILDAGNFIDYLEGTNSWAPPSDEAAADDDANATVSLSPVSRMDDSREKCTLRRRVSNIGIVTHSVILSRVVQRLFNITHPPAPPAPAPVFPVFSVKVSLIGKAFSGKSTVANALAEAHGLTVLNIETLVDEAVRDCDTDDETIENDYEGSITQLGRRAYESLVAGCEVPDDVLVALMARAIRAVTSSGWIMDGFPCSASQAALLEKVLTSFEVPSPVQPPILVAAAIETAKQKGTAEIETDSMLNKKLNKSGGGLRSKKQSIIAPEETAEQTTESVRPPKSGIDIVVLFDVDDEVVLRRAVGRVRDPSDGAHYHLEHNPPPLDPPPCDGSAPGINERLEPVQDASNDDAQLLHRLATFSEGLKPLCEWFKPFETLRVIAADVMPNEVIANVRSLLEEYLSEAHENGDDGLGGASDEEMATDILSGHGVASRTTSSGVMLASGNAPASSNGDMSAVQGGADNDGSAQVTVGATGGDDDIIDSAEIITDDNEGVSANVISNEHISGGDDPRISSAQYRLPTEELASDFIVNPELAKILSPQWEHIEDTYIHCIKYVVRQLRHEHERILRYFFDVRRSFLSFLRQPDHKQDYVSQWQRAYNSVDEDMRDDPETKAELHERLQDLKEALWDICDQSKKCAQDERACVMEEQWLEDHIGIITNLYLTLFQAECDRYQDTCQLLLDYYSGVEGIPRVVDDALITTVRVPLLQLQKVERPISAHVPSPGLSHSTPSSPTKLSSLQKKKDKTSLQPTYKQTIEDGYSVAVTVLQTLEDSEIVGAPSTGCVAATNTSGGDDGSKSALTEAVESERPMALRLEQERLTNKLENVKEHAIAAITDLVNKADNSYSIMEDLLGQRYRKEMENISSLVSLVQSAIEGEERIIHELSLHGVDFVINEDILTFEPPKPPRPSTPVEEPTADSFTVAQVTWLSEQFAAIAPSGRITTPRFVELFQQLAALSVGIEQLPDDWMGATATQLQRVCARISPLKPDEVDWRRLLVLLVAPWPCPTQQDLLYLQRVWSAVEFEKGLITLNEVNKITLWFETSDGNATANSNATATAASPTSVNTAQPQITNSGQIVVPEQNEFMRPSHVKFALAHIFRRVGYDDAVDYHDLLHHLCLDIDPSQGVRKAITLLGRPMPTPEVLNAEARVAQLHAIDASQNAMTDEQAQEHSTLIAVEEAKLTQVRIENIGVTLSELSKILRGVPLDTLTSLFQNSNIDSMITFNDIIAQPEGPTILDACENYKLINVKLPSKNRPESVVTFNHTPLRENS